MDVVEDCINRLHKPLSTIVGVSRDTGLSPYLVRKIYAEHIEKAGNPQQFDQPSPNPEETQGKTTKVYPASSLTL